MRSKSTIITVSIKTQNLLVTQSLSYSIKTNKKILFVPLYLVVKV